MTDKEAKGRSAIEAIDALEQKLEQEVPGFADIAREEQDAEAFCRSVRETMRRKRLELEMDQRAVAEHIGVTQSAVSKLENGSGDIGLLTLYRYARALGVEPDLRLSPIESASRQTRIHLSKEELMRALEEAATKLVERSSGEVIQEPRFAEME